MNILYYDSHLLVVEKPAGISVQPYLLDLAFASSWPLALRNGFSPCLWKNVHLYRESMLLVVNLPRRSVLRCMERSFFLHKTTLLPLIAYPLVLHVAASSSPFSFLKRRIRSEKASTENLCL